MATVMTVHISSHLNVWVENVLCLNERDFNQASRDGFVVECSCEGPAQEMTSGVSWPQQTLSSAGESC